MSASIYSMRGPQRLASCSMSGPCRRSTRARRLPASAWWALLQSEEDVMKRFPLAAVLLVLASGGVVTGQAQPPAPVTAIRAGRLLDPEGGRILTNQVILVEG